MKLTKAQLELLNDCRHGQPYNCSSTYKPAMKLIELGLVTGSVAKFGAFRITITDAGRKILGERS
jgi:hypothetical protein